MQFDLRFVDAGYELMMLRQFEAIVRSHLPALVSAEKARVWEDLDRDDDADRNVGHHLEDRLDEGVTTRFITGAIVVATWAVYESTVKLLADHVRGARDVKLKLSDLNGTFPEKSRKYFGEVLRTDLHPIGTDWERLERLAQLRHILAHANGRIGDVPISDWNRVKQWVQATRGISVVDDDYIVLSVEFVADARSFVDHLLRELVDRVRRDF
jgi:hypothetical protein